MARSAPVQATPSDPGPPVPDWVRAGHGGAADARFQAGAALATLHPFVTGAHPHVPQEVLRARLALSAAERALDLIGLRGTAAQLRDEVHLRRPGEDLGPAGRLFQMWRQAAAGPVSLRRVRPLLPEAMAASLPEWLGVRPAIAPVTRAAEVLAACLTAYPRAEVEALILADAALARGLGWPALVPLLGASLTRADLCRSQPDLTEACHGAVAHAAVTATALAAELSHRADRLRVVAPRVRSRAAGAAVALFLREDALSPSLALCPVVRGTTVSMSDRAARRLCERLVSLGGVRELSGRATFRLYGI